MRKLRVGRASTFRGVEIARYRGLVRWRAVIHHPRRGKLRLGEYRDEVSAALAYDFAARRRFGDVAALNFPDRRDPAPPRLGDQPPPVPADRVPRDRHRANRAFTWCR